MNSSSRCGSEQVLIPESEMRLIAAVSAQWGNTETGGTLVGLWTHGSRAVVHLALPPGPDASHEAAHFADDIEHFRSTGALLYERFGVQPIGTWHSHGGLAMDEPSGGDVNQVRSITAKNGIRRWVQIITTQNGA